MIPASAVVAAPRSRVAPGSITISLIVCRFSIGLPERSSTTGEGRASVRMFRRLPPAGMSSASSSGCQFTLQPRDSLRAEPAVFVVNSRSLPSCQVVSRSKVAVPSVYSWACPTFTSTFCADIPVRVACSAVPAGPGADVNPAAAVESWSSIAAANWFSIAAAPVSSSLPKAPQDVAASAQTSARTAMAAERPGERRIVTIFTPVTG